MNLFKNVITVSGLTFVSRIFGLVRDVCFAACLGAGPLSDAFFIAFRLPNFFRRLFAEGALNAAFVPVFSKMYQARGLPIACLYAEQVFCLLLVAVGAFVVVFELALPWIIDVLAPGFLNHPVQMQQVLQMSVLIFPYILLISLAAFYGSILNSLGKFTAAAAHPIVLNVVMIAVTAAGTYFQLNMVGCLSFGVLLSGSLQLLWMYRQALRHGIRFKLRWPRLSPPVKELLYAMAPGAMGAGVMQINLFIDTLFASLLPTGSISYLYYADRLNQLPLSLLGVGISTVLLPSLSQHFSSSDRTQAHHLQNRALELTLLFAVPATLALIILARPILSVLFEHAHFTHTDVIQTSYALQAYACGLPAYVLIRVLTTSFFAQQNTKTPVKVALCSVTVNVILTYVLMQFFHHTGIAMATAITAWLNVAILCFKLMRSRTLVIEPVLIKQLLKITMATLIMAGMLMELSNHLTVQSTDHILANVLRLMGLIGAGGLSYLISLWLSRGLNFKEMRPMPSASSESMF